MADVGRDVSVGLADMPAVMGGGVAVMVSELKHGVCEAISRVNL